MVSLKWKCSMWSVVVVFEIIYIGIFGLTRVYPAIAAVSTIYMEV